MHDMTQNQDWTPQFIVLVPKVSLSEFLKIIFGARGWTYRADVYFYSDHHTKWSLCYKNILVMHDMTQNHDQTPLSPFFL